MKARLKKLEKKILIAPDEQPYLSKEIDSDTYTIQPIMMKGKPKPKKLTRAEFEQFKGTFTGQLIQVEWYEANG